MIKAHDPAVRSYLYLAFDAPHAPCPAPQAALDRYEHIAEPHRRAYAASVTAMDAQIGRVVVALEQRGMREQADRLPERQRRHARRRARQRARTHLGRQHGRGHDARRRHVPDADGSDRCTVGAQQAARPHRRVAVDRQSKPSPRTEVVYKVEPYRAGVREGDWRLVWRTPLPESVELYDIATEPGERTNVAAARPDKVAAL